MQNICVSQIGAAGIVISTVRDRRWLNDNVDFTILRYFKETQIIHYLEILITLLFVGLLYSAKLILTQRFKTNKLISFELQRLDFEKPSSVMLFFIGIFIH